MAKKGSFEAKLAAKAKKLEKRKEEREASSGGFATMFKPRVGDQFIRVLPHWEKPNSELGEDEFFFVEKAIHYIPKVLDSGTTINIPVPCQKEQLGEESCLMCDAVAYLKRKASKAKDLKKEKAAKALSTKAGKIRKQTKSLYNILDYGKKGEIEANVAVWACPETVHEDIMEWAGDLGDFSDLDEGRDWRLKKKVDKKRGPIGTSYKVIPNMKDTKVPVKLRELLEGDDGMRNLNNVWTEDPTEDMEKALTILGIELDTAAPEEDADDTEVEAKATKKKVSKKKTTKRAGAKKAKPKEEVEEEPEEDAEYDPSAGFASDGEEETGEEEGDLGDDLGIDASDDELEAELKDLGVK